MLEILESVPSTMDAARDNIRAGRVRFDAQGSASPAGVLAREQTAGRGQRGRTWYARPGECLCATYYFQYGLTTLEQASQAAFVAGVVVAETLQRVCQDAFEENAFEDEAENAARRLPRVGLKWPNDLLLNGKKAGGILIEVTAVGTAYMQARQSDIADEEVINTEGTQNRLAPVSFLPQADSTLPVALIGVGVNVDVMDFPPELADSATSLRREGVRYGEGRGWRLLGKQIADALAHWGGLWRDAGLQPVLDRWRDFDRTPGREYETVLNGENISGTAEGIDAAGALLLRLADGRRVAVRSASSLVERV